MRDDESRHIDGTNTGERIRQRTRERDGKASAVHFFHFDFTVEAIASWKSGEGTAMVVIDHPAYGHAAIVSKETRTFLGRECF